MNLLETTISFFERLGICVAVFAGSGAIIVYRDKVLPVWPTGAFLVGLLLLFVSFFLCVYVSADFYSNISKITSKKPVQFILAGLVVIIGVFFLIAGGSAAVSSLHA